MFVTYAQNGALQLFGVTLVGATPENGRKLVLTLLWIAGSLLLGWALSRLASLVRSRRSAFWVRQAVHILVAAVLLIGMASIWFDDPNRLATAVGLVTAGLAFALQRVITATAGYFIILRGKTFNVGDRIVMGGVRGDVVALSFMQTTILEMGQPPSVQSAVPAMWVRSRQYTGRVVTVSNAKVFDEPVYNYTRDFHYIWEEMSLPISYKDDRQKAERILLAAARRHTVDIAALKEDEAQELEQRFGVKLGADWPRTYWRLTDNWLEITVRFVAGAHGVRDVKDAMTREILLAFDEAGIGIASATYEIVGFPDLRIAANRGAEQITAERLTASSKV